MKQYVYTPRGVCARQITFELDGETVHNVAFQSGCNGNLKAIGKLVEGKNAREIADILAGNDCAGRGTSCADQLSIALKLALEKAAG